MTKIPEASDTRRIIERAEVIRARIQDSNDDLKVIFDEAKGNGHDVAALRKILTRRAKIAKNAAKVADEEAMIELYQAALGGE